MARLEMASAQSFPRKLNNFMQRITMAFASTGNQQSFSPWCSMMIALGVNRRHDTETPMTHRIPVRWKILTVFLITCGLASLFGWAILLTSFYSHPRVPAPERQRDIAYSCHGMTVFISHFENTMRHWLIPIGGFFIVLGLLAAVMGLIAAGTIRINVSVNVTDASKHEGHS